MQFSGIFHKEEKREEIINFIQWNDKGFVLERLESSGIANVDNNMGYNQRKKRMILNLLSSL